MVARVTGGLSEQDVGHGAGTADQDRAEQVGLPHHHGDPQSVRRQPNLLPLVSIQSTARNQRQANACLEFGPTKVRMGHFLTAMTTASSTPRYEPRTHLEA